MQHIKLLCCEKSSINRLRKQVQEWKNPERKHASVQSNHSALLWLLAKDVKHKWREWNIVPVEVQRVLQFSVVSPEWSNTRFAQQCPFAMTCEPLVVLQINIKAIGTKVVAMRLLWVQSSFNLHGHIHFYQKERGKAWRKQNCLSSKKGKCVGI